MLSSLVKRIYFFLKGEKSVAVCFALMGMVMVLWQLLLPGYVLTLDMVFGPKVNLAVSANSLLSALPFKYVLALVTAISSGWFAQKMVLVALFFSLFYLPLWFFKKIFSLERTYGSEYVAALVFAINPYVYERFLAGQWAVLCGYVLLVPFVAYLVDFSREQSSRATLKLAGILLLLGVLSSHTFTIAGVILAGVLVALLIAKKGEVTLIKKIGVLGAVVLVGSSYWLVPATLGTATPVPTFNAEHWEVFKTAGDEHMGVVGNVLSLHGFWGEREPWIERFVVPKENGVGFFVPFLTLCALVLSGVYAGVRAVSVRAQVLCMVVVTVCAVVFSCGIGEGFLRNINLWLFEYVPFWKGFRDSQKWSGVVALSYALFAGLGAYTLFAWMRTEMYRKGLLVVFACLPLAITPMMLFGFAGQLQTTDYPESWAEVNAILAEDEKCKALFLPWHQYYSLKFNNDLLVANTSGSYFDCEVVSGKNMELGSIESQGGHGEEYERVERVVTDNEARGAEVVALLRELGIGYVIFTTDVLAEDQFHYPFLEEGLLEEVKRSDEVVLYRIPL